MSQRNPFKFLDAYTVEDRDLFFGRDLEIAELYSTFFTHRLSVVYGESGTGKTSLIQCGLQAEIPEEDALFIPVRSAVGALQSLEKEVRKQLEDIPEDDSIDQLLEELWYQESRTLVLVLDQFEEFFLFRSKSERMEFSQRLAHWLSHCPYIRVIISIREEYYARLTELESQLPQLYSNRLWVRRMSREQAREVITQPCKICNVEIEDKLIDTLLNDLTLDNKEVDLPTLQVVLDGLYQEAEKTQSNKLVLTLSVYQELGKISKILARFIENCIQKQKNADEFKQVLKAMISAQGTRKISKLEDIQQGLTSFGSEIDVKEVKAILKQLSKDRIIREDIDDQLYELRHDSLAITIQSWMSISEKELLEIRQIIDNRYQEYLQRGALLDSRVLNDISGYLTHLNLSDEVDKFIKKSQQHIRRQKHYFLFRIIGVALIFTVISYFWYQADLAKQEALHEREQAIFLINSISKDIQGKLDPIEQLKLAETIQPNIIQYFNLLKISSEDTTTLRQKAIAIQQSANSLMIQDKYDEALQAYSEAQKLFNRIIKNNNKNIQRTNDLFLNNMKIANTYKAMGEYNYSIGIYKKLLISTKKYTKENPKNKKWQYNISFIYISLGEAYNANNQKNESIASYKKSLEISRKISSINPADIQILRGMSVAYSKLEEVYKSLGQSENVIEIHKEVLKVAKLLEKREARDIGDEDLESASTYINLGEVYLNQGNYKKALYLYQKALTIQIVNLGADNLNVSKTYNNIGSIYISMGEYNKSLEYYKKSLVIQEAIPQKETSNIAITYSSIGLSYASIGDKHNALKFNQKALEIYRKSLGEKHPSVAISYRQNGLTYSDLGDYPKALKYYFKALHIQEKILNKYHPDTTLTYSLISLAYKNMRDYSKSLEYLQKALIINIKLLGKEHPDTATSYNSIGLTYSSMNNYAKALDYYQKSLIIREKSLGKKHPSVANSYSNIGVIYYLMGEYIKALKYQQRALTIQRAALDVTDLDLAIAESYDNIALIYIAMKDYPKSLEYYQKSLTIKIKSLGKNHISTRKSYSNLGVIYKYMKNYKMSYKFEKTAFDIFVYNRDKNFPVLDFKQKKLYLKSNKYEIKYFLSSSIEHYQDCINKNKVEEALRVKQVIVNDWLVYKGSILNSENSLITLAKKYNDPDFINKYKSLFQLKRDYAKLYQSHPSSDKVELWKKQLNQKKNRISELQSEILQGKDYLQTISSENIAKTLDKGEVYLDYAKAGDTYFIFTIDYENNISFSKISKNDSKIIDNQVDEFNKIINTVTEEGNSTDKLNKQSRSVLSQLYKLTFNKKLSEQLTNKDSLIISPDGALQLLPFEALYDSRNQQYLIENKNIRYITSGKELIRLSHNNSRSKNKNIVIFSNPNFDMDLSNQVIDILEHRGLSKSYFPLSPLPGTKREADSINKIMAGSNIPIQNYSQDTATEANLLKVKQPKILHIATSGFFDTKILNPMLQSGIALAGANYSFKNNKGKGIVTALSLSGLNLTGTELVVLSACDTGKVDPNHTDSIKGLNAAFFQAGTKNIVSSLWQVADKETADLMASFYEYIVTTNGNYVLALRRSKLEMIKQGMHPYYWAGFVLNGL